MCHGGPWCVMTRYDAPLLSGVHAVVFEQSFCGSAQWSGSGRGQVGGRAGAGKGPVRAWLSSPWRWLHTAAAPFPCAQGPTPVLASRGLAVYEGRIPAEQGVPERLKTGRSPERSWQGSRADGRPPRLCAGNLTSASSRCPGRLTVLRLGATCYPQRRTCPNAPI